MFNLNILRLSSIVLISLSSCLCALAPASIQVLNPSEFDVILAPDENGTLLDVRININREFGSGEPDYRKKNVTGRVIHFSERSLILKRGDIIYYSLTFDDGDRGLRGDDGNYIFNGVYKRRDSRGREVYEQGSEETSEEKNVNQDSESEESRYLRHRPRGHPSHHGPHHHHHFGPPNFFPPPFGAPHHPPPYPGPVYKRRDSRGREVFGQISEETSEEKNVNQDSESEESRYLRHRPRGHPSHHGPHYRHHFDLHHFFPPPFGAPHHPPPYSGPDAWREHSYEHTDNFGNHGSWEDHDSHDCNSFGHKPKNPEGKQRPKNSKPWRGGPEDNPYSNSNGNNGFDRHSGGKQNKGTGSGNDNPNESGDSSKNENTTTTENSFVEVFTTRRTVTTARTTTVSNIDIRIRLPDDN